MVHPNDEPQRVGIWQRLRHWGARADRWFWPALAVAVLVIQWPMLKGVYYRAMDTPPPSTAIEWRTDLDAALDEARRADKLVFVDFSADWCPPCIAMKHDVWPDPSVERAMQSYVPVLIDVDRNSTVPARYGVQGIPTILILDDTGRVVGRTAFRSAAALVRFLEDPTEG